MLRILILPHKCTILLRLSPVNINLQDSFRSYSQTYRMLPQERMFCLSLGFSVYNHMKFCIHSAQICRHEYLLSFVGRVVLFS